MHMKRTKNLSPRNDLVKQCHQGAHPKVDNSRAVTDLKSMLIEHRFGKNKKMDKKTGHSDP